MNTDNTNGFDDESFLRTIREAFEDQPISEPDAERDWLRRVLPVDAPVDRHKTVIGGSNQHWIPSLISLAAVVGMAVFFFGGFSKEEAHRVSVDDPDRTHGTESTDSPESSLEQTQLAVEPSPQESNVVPDEAKRGSSVEPTSEHSNVANTKDRSGSREPTVTDDHGDVPPNRDHAWVPDIARVREDAAVTSQDDDLQWEELLDTPKSVSPTRWRDTVKAANAYLAGKVGEPGEWLLHLERDFDFDISGLRVFLASSGVPRGVKSIRTGAEPKLSWAAGKNQFASTYRFDTKEVLADLKRFVDAHFDASVYEEVLDGIRDDRDGPQIDLRKEFFPRLQGQMLLVITPAANRRDAEEFMMVFPMADPSVIWSMVDKAHRKEPDSVLGTYRSLPMWRNTSNENRPIVWCMAGDCLVIGQPETVQSAIDRRLADALR